MELFKSWAASRNITFKRVTHRRAAFEVWKECQIEVDAVCEENKRMRDEIAAVTLLLKSMRRDADGIQQR